MRKDMRLKATYFFFFFEAITLGILKGRKFYSFFNNLTALQL